MGMILYNGPPTTIKAKKKKEEKKRNIIGCCFGFGGEREGER